MSIKISLKQLDAFVWIARLQTFERAAAKLCTTQSAISKRVQELERACGFELFDRSQRGARLTLQGEELLELAQTILTQCNKIDEIRQGKSQIERTLRLGVTESTAMTWLPQLVAQIDACFSQVQIAPKVDMSRSLFVALEHDEVDLIIVPDVFESSRCRKLPICTVQNVWVAKPGLVRTSGRISAQELTHYPMLVQGSLSGSGLFLNNWLHEQGVVFNNVLSCDSIIALLGLAVAGLGIAYIPYHFFHHLLVKEKLALIDCDSILPPVPYIAMFRDDKPHAFIEKIAELSVSCADFEQGLGN